MNLQKLFEMQHKLDQHIEKEHPQQEGENRRRKKILALLVEIGELANETRCFKFWSVKPPAPRERQLEEAADILHFILSIGNDLKIDGEQTIKPHKLAALESQFLWLFECVQCLYTEELDQEATWIETMDVFSGLIEMLGFTWEQIEEAYYRKNEINHARQVNKY